MLVCLDRLLGVGTLVLAKDWGGDSDSNVFLRAAIEMQLPVSYFH